MECTSERKEKKSEGFLVKELVRILKPELQLRVEKILGRSSFNRTLERSTESVIHVSAHGRYYYKKTTRVDLPSGKWITPDQIQKIINKRSEKPVLMVFSACSVANRDMVESLKEVGVKYFMAPEEDVYWFDAAIYLTAFYRFLFVENRSPWIAYRNTDLLRKRFFPKLSGIWQFFQDGKLCYSSPYSRYKLGRKVTMNI